MFSRLFKKQREGFSWCVDHTFDSICIVKFLTLVRCNVPAKRKLCTCSSSMYVLLACSSCFKFCTDFPLLLLCIVCGYKFFLCISELLQFWELMMLQPWRIFRNTFVIFTMSLLRFGFPFKGFIHVDLEAFRKFQNSYTRAIKSYGGNLVWPEDQTVWLTEVVIEWLWWGPGIQQKSNQQHYTFLFEKLQLEM